MDETAADTTVAIVGQMVDEDPIEPQAYQPLTAAEKNSFEYLKLVARKQQAGTELVLMRAQVGGRDRAMVMAVDSSGSEMTVSPLAMLVTDELFGLSADGA